MELVRAINFHGHNLANENLYDNIRRFFENNGNFKEIQKIYDIIYSIENNILIEEIEDKNEEEKSIPKYLYQNYHEMIFGIIQEILFVN